MKALVVFLTTLFLSFSLSAAEIKVDMLNKDANGNRMVYSEEIIRVDVGDTVTWLPTAKGHNVEFRAGPKSFKAPKKSKVGKEYSYTFDVPGVYVYWCTPHKSMGMIGLVVVGQDTSNLKDIKKTKMFGKSKKKYKKLLGEL